MSTKKIEKVKSNFKGKTNKELEDALKSLTSELQRYQTMAIKAQGAIEVLEQLEQDGYVLCCATNSVRHSATIQLTRRGFIDHLEFIFTNQDVVNPKPNTEIYLRCMIKAGVSPKETIILEDSELGRKGARATGSPVLEIKDSADVTYRKIRKFIENVK